MTRRVAIGCALLGLAGGALAIDGRWEGTLQAGGGAPVAVIVDVAIAEGRAPLAIVTLPGRSVQRARIAALALQGGAWQGAASPSPGVREADALRLELREERGALAGTLTLGGHAAPILLARSGPSVLTERALSALPQTVWGRWRGRYDLGFGVREVTLRIDGEGASVTVVGRRTTELRFDVAGRQGAFLRLAAEAADFSIEAAWARAAEGVLDATVRQGPFEAALLLQRERAP